MTGKDSVKALSKELRGRIGKRLDLCFGMGLSGKDPLEGLLCSECDVLSECETEFQRCTQVMK